MCMTKNGGIKEKVKVKVTLCNLSPIQEQIQSRCPSMQMIQHFGFLSEIPDATARRPTPESRKQLSTIWNPGVANGELNSMLLKPNLLSLQDSGHHPYPLSPFLILPFNSQFQKLAFSEASSQKRTSACCTTAKSSVERLKDESTYSADSEEPTGDVPPRPSYISTSPSSVQSQRLDSP